MPTVTTNYFKLQEGGQNVSISGDTWIASPMNNHVNSATADTLRDYELWSEVSAYEASGTGYTSGATLANVGWVTNDTSNTQIMSADDISFSNVTLTVYGVTVWRQSDGLIMGFIDFGATPTSSLNANLNIAWNSSGILNKI